MNNSLNTLAMNLGSDVAQDIIVAAVRLGMDRDDIYTVLTTMKDDLINPILLNLNDDAITKAKIGVVTDKMYALRSRLNDTHNVNMCLIDRDAIQGRDWQTDMISGVVRNLYIAKDIVDEGNLQAFDRIVSSIVPFFFGERTTTLSSANMVEEPTLEKKNIPVAETAPKQVPMVEPVEEAPVEEHVPDPAADIAVAVKNAIAASTIKTTKVDTKPTVTTTTTRRRPAVKVIR